VSTNAAAIFRKEETKRMKTRQGPPATKRKDREIVH
jgi:hypothetical protein